MVGQAKIQIGPRPEKLRQVIQKVNEEKRGRKEIERGKQGQ